MKIKAHARNGQILTFKNIHPGLFDENICMVEVKKKNYDLSVNLKKGRLIFYEKEGIYYLGKQITKGGRNLKSIFELGDNNVEIL